MASEHFGMQHTQHNSLPVFIAHRQALHLLSADPPSRLLSDVLLGGSTHRTHLQLTQASTAT